MSRLLISRSQDLRQLRDEGYDLEIRGGYLLTHDVPYVATVKEVAYGTLVSELNLANGVTVAPNPHTVRFTGTPCDAEGRRLDRIINDTSRTDLGNGLVVEASFSHKPVPGGRYADYYAKITTYVAILGRYAAAVDPNATARTYRLREEREDGSPFRYPDTASARAGITAITGKLAVGKVAIVGLGGTGSHILDLIAKTPVREIHLFDGDRMLDHNAFCDPVQRQLPTWTVPRFGLVRGVLVHHDQRAETDRTLVACALDREYIAGLDARWEYHAGHVEGAIEVALNRRRGSQGRGARAALDPEGDLLGWFEAGAGDVHGGLAGLDVDDASRVPAR